MALTTENQYRAVYLTADDLRIAASILYTAYHDDLVFKDALYCGDDHLYEQKLRGAIREELNELWQQEQTLVGLFDDDRLVGVACVVNSAAAVGQSRYWHWRLKMLLSTGWQSTQKWVQKERSIQEHLPSGHSGILQFLAISPSEQGKHLGGKLIDAITHWCDEQPELEGIGVFVTNEHHLALFHQYQFKHLSDLVIGNVSGELLFYGNTNN
ncbi:GNAT family N-acetyltransferase [Shewanella sp. NIFS-20-20]|uniref:GNAT family N-acetyltransferase n=1 Tax=Shewanella sp. NIFS-20-20 TaxID=2853806 RepID=UPI001C44C892|nr:GNAT family N-acetyltransferase [Shewanella sp. NIFS-20-20]MBV7317327.1 GNAT family N-acetyltransferase [Shewanella sp. NIFS-20-20]